MKNILHLVRPNIQKMTAYSSARSEFKGKAEVFLDANENPFDTGFNRYPDPLQKRLKVQISTIKNVDTEHIFLGNGSDEAIDLLIRVFCEPREDCILILPPTYGMYQVSAAIADVALEEVKLTADFEPDVPAILEKANEKTKILFLCSPNNPTGNSFSLKKIKTLLENFPGIVVVDEAYIDFSAQASLTNLLPQFPNLVILQTFSKAWGLAGIRLGMAFASSTIIDLLNKVKPPYNINQLTQAAALQALENKNAQQVWVETILQQRDFLQKELIQFPFIKKIYPSDANFLLVKMDKPDECYRYLVEKNIIVRNRSKVVLCEGCLRITVGTEEENERLLKVLKQI